MVNIAADRGEIIREKYDRGSHCTHQWGQELNNGRANAMNKNIEYLCEAKL